MDRIPPKIIPKPSERVSCGQKMKNNPSNATSPSARIVEYGADIRSYFLKMFILTPVVLDTPNDPKLSDSGPGTRL
jgi:hypothetical protein